MKGDRMNRRAMRGTRAALLAGLAMLPAGAWAQTGAVTDANAQAESFNDNIDPQLRLNDANTVSRDVSSTLRIDEDDRNDIALRRAASLRPADRMRGTTVNERARPDYDPAGLKVGGFTLFPEIGARAYATSNVYRQASGRSDIYGTVRGAVVGRSDWARHQLILSGNVDQSVYSKFSTEDATTYGVSGDGRIDIDNLSSIGIGASFSHDIVDRGASTEVLQTRKPVRSDRIGVTVGLTRQFGRLNATVGGEYVKLDFEDAQAPDGSFLSQQYRNFSEYTAKGRLGYNFVAGREVYASLTYSARDFPNPVPDERVRDVKQWEALAGLASEITPLLRGHIGFGYVVGDFTDPETPTRRGLAVDAALTYLYSELTTFTLTARRTLRNASLLRAPAAMVTGGQLRVDHELLRNVIVSARGGYEQASYIDQDSKASVWNAGVSARWLVNRNLRVTGDVSYRDRGVDGLPVVTTYSAITGSIGVSWLF